MDLGTRAARVDFLVPGVLALAVMSTAFTGLAIATGFERRYGALKRLGASPLPRGALLGGQGPVGAGHRGPAGAAARPGRPGLGWDPRGSWLAVLRPGAPAPRRSPGSALLMAGTLRAEATLAAANLVYLLFLVGGGIAVPLSTVPRVRAGRCSGAARRGAVRGAARRAPATAARCPGDLVGVLLVWAVVAGALAARTFGGSESVLTPATGRLP